MKHRLAFTLIAAAALLRADQLTLTNGRRVTGSFLDGNARSIRFVTGDAIKTYPANEVSTIRLGDALPDPPTTPAAGNVLPAGLSLIVKFLEPVDSRHNAVGMTYQGTLVSGLPTAQTPLIPAGSDVVLKLVNDDASGPINGNAVLTMAVVSITTLGGKAYDVSTVRMAPGVPPSGKFSTLKMAVIPPVSAIGDRVHVPAGTILVFTLAEPVVIH